MTLLNATSAGVIGGIGFLARSVSAPSTTEAAITAGLPLNFSISSGERSSVYALLRFATSSGENLNTSPTTVM